MPGVPEPYAVPWPRPSLSVVLTDATSVEWTTTVTSHLEDLATQPGVEVIVPVDRFPAQVGVLRPVSVVECPEGEVDAGLCPRVRGVARAVGNVVVFREIGSARGSHLGLPPLWEPCPPRTADLLERLRSAGVERPEPPETG